MEMYLFVATLVVALSVSHGSTGLFPGSRATSLNLSVASRRNLTGHWIVSVDLAAEDPNSVWQLQRPREVDLQVGHGTTSCENSESVHITALAMVAGTAAVPADYEQILGLGKYKLHTTALTWHDAQKKCVQEGANLIVINSDQEADVVKTIVARKPKIVNSTPGQGHLCYVGFHDHDTEGRFISVLGQPLSSSGYARWGKGQPNGVTNENCMVADSGAIYWDAPCSWTLMFICEASA